MKVFIAVDIIKIAPEVLVPCLMPNWDSFSLPFRLAQHESLSLKTAVNTLPMIGSNVIPL